MERVRIEFTAKTKKAAKTRSGGFCEASGPFYNRAFDSRCSRPLERVEYDHFIRAADGGDASLDNCRAVCPECHSWKTRHIDTPGAAKTKRIIRKAGPVEYRRKPKVKLKGRSFSKPTVKPKWPSRPFQRKSDK